ncbi:DNA-binding transcriptional regulator, MarR family [Brevibacterium iodinum ATCC 49514]|uniref:DNA-binding transcriptional regulator, MarR family n=2 Tax=Brevibacterium iodinum TaxID=31943 RepID=A0A2H1KJA4_9MICO|nr:DNA-binding transcriptional regulator, MarR family [Brevibacterium iodinum ATCC 49514]SUW11389.1 Predicted transcriptional regulator [Brevibacterium iodinum]
MTLSTCHAMVKCMYMESSEPKGGGVARNLSAAWAQVAAVVAAVDATLGKWLMDNYGIGLTDYRAILHLSRASDSELRIHDLADKVGLSQSSATRLVGRLEGKGLVARDTCPDDARGVYAVVTNSGLQAVSDIRTQYEAKIRELLESADRQYPQLDLAELDRSFETISELIS